jgi:hypothetical protein
MTRQRMIVVTMFTVLVAVSFVFIVLAQAGLKYP